MQSPPTPLELKKIVSFKIHALESPFLGYYSPETAGNRIFGFGTFTILILRIRLFFVEDLTLTPL